jgi:biopolymer transport protein ExbB
MSPVFSRFRLGWALAALAFAAGVAPARAWWDGDWTERKLITVDTTTAGTPIGDPIGSVPVLLRLHDGNFQFANAKPDGTDLRFVAADDKTLLAYHIEKFDSLLNEAFVWVNVPEVKPGAKTTFWLYYGNAGPKAVKVESAKDTFDADTELVYHFNERGQPAYDFTGHGNNAESAGVAADGSMIGTGLRLDGKTAIAIPASNGLTWIQGGAMTWSAWIKFGAPQSNAVFFGRHDANNSFIIGADAGVPFVALTYQGSLVRSAAGVPVPPNTWHHVAVVAGGASVTLYLDGEVYATATAPLPPLNVESVLGGQGGMNSASLAGFTGEIDELEIARSARSPGFIKFAAVQQGPDGTAKLVTLGEDEQAKNWLSFLKEGTIGVIIGSLTLDGWIVIGLLGVMLFVSWVVMISKARYLSLVSKSNAVFLKEWRKVAADLSVLDQGEEEGGDPAARAKGGAPGMSNHAGLRHSPLYHIYHVGVQEIRHRLAAFEDGSGKKVISARSIEAIRASLDGGLVRETQRLTSQMVLLTIAISGGPFLGLLGTVVGVMITFAAVAQAGDVNVNAIAPGIAAALAATVAGLAVAIPSLFGYNYLLTQVKSATSDMQVFIDEFVTRLAEFYRGDGE